MQGMVVVGRIDHGQSLQVPKRCLLHMFLYPDIHHHFTSTNNTTTTTTTTTPTECHFRNILCRSIFL